MPDVFISRQPLINRQNRILANRLCLHLVGGATTADAAQTLASLADYWPADEKQVFLHCGKSPCDTGLLQWNPPANTTIELQGASFAAPDAAALISRLQENPSSLCLMIDEHAKTALSSGASFRFMGLNAQRFSPAQLKTLAAQTQPYGIGVAFNVYDRQSFQNCLDAGVNAAATWFFKRPSSAPAKALNPGQAQIIRVLNLVRKNADV